MNKRRHTFRLINFCLILQCSFTAFAQDNEKRRLSVGEWVEEMVNCKDSVYYLENAEIYYDDEQDTSYRGRKRLPETIIEAEVYIGNCKFPEYNVDLNDITFNQMVNIAYCNNIMVFDFLQCTFKEGLNLYDSEMGRVRFDSCTFEYAIGVVNMEISALHFSDCHFNLKEQTVYSVLGLGTGTKAYNYQYVSRFIQAKNRINYLSFDNCKIETDKKTPVFNLMRGNYGTVSINDIDLSDVIVDFESSIIEDALIIENCVFNKPVGTMRFDFPENNILFRWDVIEKNGLAIYNGQYDDQPYMAENDSQLADVNQYYTLISGYKKFFNAYKNQGDLESANACYIDMKDIETRRLNYLYRQDLSMTSWFNWQLNRFLNFFCDYGTSPVKSLIISLWTILGFAVLYFFVYSDWDRINRAFLIRQHRKMLTYFRSEQKMEEFYTDEYKEDFQTYEGYRRELQESKIEVPFFINALGRPLYHLSLAKHKSMAWIYRRTEILQERWTDLKPTRKVFVGITVGLAIIIYLLYLGLVRALNSIVLSINTFSTLGFGDIPVKGISRYVAILEGFLGWFLLSIFSVSLISQILQN